MKKNIIIINNLISLKTIINKELIRIFRIWPQTILPQIVTTSLYFLIFGNLIGKKIGNMSSYTYIEYIIPGLIMMAIITSSYSNVVSSFFGSKFQKNIEEILISPTYNITIIIGFTSGGVIRSLIIYILILITSSIFSNIHFYNITIFIIAYITTSILFSFLGLINGIFAKKFDDISIIPTFILTPLIYLGGIFYSIDILPDNLKVFVYTNPIFYINNIFRYGMLGISEIDIFKSFFIMMIHTNNYNKVNKIIYLINNLFI
ncbi:MAG TPA: ABC transporter permease [Candidatus Azoamicus sp.]